MAMAPLDAVLLGIVEGITEFLPISSTAHLLLLEQWLGISDPGHTIAITMQLGAILAVCVVYWKRLIGFARGLVTGDAERRSVFVLAVATLPAAIIGIPLDKYLWTDPNPTVQAAVIAGALAVGGLVILFVERQSRTPLHTTLSAIPWRVAAIIGCCQCLAALVPGTSRSGAIIIGGLLLGLSRPLAAELAFLLAIPAMLGASTIKLMKHPEVLHDAALRTPMLISFIVSFVVGLVVVVGLLRWVSTRTFTPFAWYRIALGLAVAVWLVVR